MPRTIRRLLVARVCANTGVRRAVLVASGRPAAQTRRCRGKKGADVGHSPGVRPTRTGGQKKRVWISGGRYLEVEVVRVDVVDRDLRRRISAVRGRRPFDGR